MLIPLFTLVLAAACLVILAILLMRKPPAYDAPFAQMREELRASAAGLRAEVAASIRSGDDSLFLKLHELTRSVTEHGKTQREDLERVRAQIEKLSDANEARLESVRNTVDARLQTMQATVDEKLQETLERRLGDSFARVSERLELVHQSLGEMKSLASGVGDLKKVLSNVKSRGVWGEVQLESLLDQILSPEQYVRNVTTREETRESVEFAVKFPGKGDTPLLLPLDAKFPIEDYQQLLDAHDRADAEAIDATGRRLESTVRNAAKAIREKYVNPPVTTEFAIMFLPIEGLYAEVLRRPGLAEEIQRTCSVLIAGPTTLAAILCSLQMGFRTLAIEKRSAEVWRLLEAVKTEFAKYGEVVEKVSKTLNTARNHLDEVGRRTRVVTKKLRDVDSLPEPEAKLLLKLDSRFVDDDDDDDVWVEPTERGRETTS